MPIRATRSTKLMLRCFSQCSGRGNTVLVEKYLGECVRSLFRSICDRVPICSRPVPSCRNRQFSSCLSQICPLALRNCKFSNKKSRATGCRGTHKPNLRFRNKFLDLIGHRLAVLCRFQLFGGPPHSTRPSEVLVLGSVNQLVIAQRTLCLTCGHLILERRRVSSAPRLGRLLSLLTLVITGAAATTVAPFSRVSVQRIFLNCLNSCLNMKDIVR